MPSPPLWPEIEVRWELSTQTHTRKVSSFVVDARRSVAAQRSSVSVADDEEAPFRPLADAAGGGRAGRVMSTHASEMEEGRGGIEVRGREDARVRGEVDIRRGTLLGSPFMMRHEGERDGVCAAYADMISGGEAAHVLARRWAVGGKSVECARVERAYVVSEPSCGVGATGTVCARGEEGASEV